MSPSLYAPPPCFVPRLSESLASCSWRSTATSRGANKGLQNVFLTFWGAACRVQASSIFQSPRSQYNQHIPTHCSAFGGRKRHLMTDSRRCLQCAVWHHLLAGVSHLRDRHSGLEASASSSSTNPGYSSSWVPRGTCRGLLGGHEWSSASVAGCGKAGCGKAGCGKAGCACLEARRGQEFGGMCIADGLM